MRNVSCSVKSQRISSTARHHLPGQLASFDSRQELPTPVVRRRRYSDQHHSEAARHWVRGHRPAVWRQGWSAACRRHHQHPRGYIRRNRHAVVVVVVPAVSRLQDVFSGTFASDILPLDISSPGQFRSPSRTFHRRLKRKFAKMADPRILL